jgi:hypothetical protein
MTDSSEAGVEVAREFSDPVAFPKLSSAQLVRLRAYGTEQSVEAGDILYGPGDPTYDLVVVEDATGRDRPASERGTGGRRLSCASVRARFSAGSTC